MNNIKQNRRYRFTSAGFIILVGLGSSIMLHAAAGPRKKQSSTTQQPKTTRVDDQLNVTEVVGEMTRDRQELKTMRDKFMQEYKQQGMQSNCMQITTKITQATMAYVNQRIAETIKKLGPAPTKFSLFTLGSMARDESGFFTDLEIGIFVAKKDAATLNYFKRFSQVLADRFFRLGEHPDVGGKGLRIDEGDNAPDHLRWYARYASPDQLALLNEGEIGKGPYEGSRVYVTTPQEFAALMDPLVYKKLADRADMPQEDKNVAIGVSAISRNMRHLYGDEVLFKQYMQLRERHLRGKPEYSNPNYTNRREEIAYFNLEHDLKKQNKPGSPVITGKLGDTLDIKRTIYRFPEQMLTSLGFWHNVGVQNTAQIADKLVAIKQISPQWGEALKDLMNFTVCLRLKKQIKFGKQGFDIPVTQKGYTQLKQETNAELAAANKSLATAKAAKDAKAIMQAEEDITKAKVSLQDLEKMAPGKPDPILTPEIITALNTKYLPLEKKLYETLQKFVDGDKNAFLGTDVGVVIQPVAAPVTSGKTPVKKK